MYFDEQRSFHEFNILIDTTCRDLLNAFNLPTDGTYELTEHWRECGKCSQ